MKQLIAFILLALFTCPTFAQNSLPVVLQLKYSPLGIIDADEDEFDRNGRSYEKYEMDFERSLGAKLIIAPMYVSVNRNVTNLNDPIPDAIVITRC